MGAASPVTFAAYFTPSSESSGKPQNDQALDLLKCLPI